MKFLKQATSGLTLLELLVVLALSVGMLSLGFPAWRAFEQRTTEHAFMSFLLQSCECARTAAIAQRTETWMLFQHRQPTAPDRFCILQQENPETISTLRPWVTLPRHLSFLLTPQTIKNEPLPMMMQQALPVNFQEEIKRQESSFVRLEWDTSGSISYPKEGEPLLIITPSSNPSDSNIKNITLPFSRRIGRVQFTKNK